jgi:hypothetical protein
MGSIPKNVLPLRVTLTISESAWSAAGIGTALREIANLTLIPARSF